MARASQQLRVVSNLAVALDDFDPPSTISGSSVTALPVPGVRVLVVDDDPRIRRSTANALSRIGFHVITADDGGPALVMAEQTPPDLAVIDLNMPTYGLDVVRTLKARYGAALWVAVLSGQDDEETRSACYAAGADDVLVKPAAVAEFRRRMLAAARSQQAYVEARLGREQIERRLAYGAEATALLAHDLNNGLAVALANMSHLEEAGVLHGDLADALAATVRALSKMSGLVSNFVDVARFEDAAVKPQCTEVLILGLLEEVADTHRHNLDRKIGFELRCTRELSGWFDVVLVERVLHNLVGNATRYCAPGGTIRIGAQLDSKQNVVLSVGNDGPPIPPEIEGQLFAKYAKGKTGKRGFGLYFCRLACEAHGGGIGYQSDSTGPSFIVKLPGRG